MKKVISCLLFCVLIAGSLIQLTEFLIPKSDNRYYIMKEYLEDTPQQNLHDVQIYGSCHAYTSFNPEYFEEHTGVSAFVYAAPSEIIPTTYLRMTEQFKIHVPKVVLVETWGINPYETYIKTSGILGSYLSTNIELFPYSREKQEVIDDFNTLDNLSIHFPLIRYKERLTDESINLCDFDYSFENTQHFSSEYIYNEMSSRLSNNGFKKNPSRKALEYTKRQSVIEEDALTNIEPVVVKYLYKIIELCKENNVELIFYRAPYISTVNELQKLNHLRQICSENNLPFIDLESEINFNYYTDFYDYEHLSEIGANRSTELLAPYVIDALEKQGTAAVSLTEDNTVNLLRNSNFTVPENQSGQIVFSTTGKTIDNWNTDLTDCKIHLKDNGIEISNTAGIHGWSFFQLISVSEKFAGKSLTAEFQVEDSHGVNILPTIFCYDENSTTLQKSHAPLEKGNVYLSCVVPEGTKYIRIGFYSPEDTLLFEHATVKSIELYEGAYTATTWFINE